ncbi:DUF2778 domain-containing protein [bacterium]|nr:DUF2778 domain-containing protein [bacterium]
MTRFIWIFLWFVLISAPILGNNNLVFEFNGKALIGRQNNQVVLTMPASAGRPFFRSPSYQYLKNKGPLPEGIYTVEWDNTVYFSQPGMLNTLKWLAKYIAWGNLAIPLTPDASTDLKGRHSFMIHGGGWVVGSKGCVVVYGRDKELYRFLKRSQVPVKLVVRYER